MILTGSLWNSDLDSYDSGSDNLHVCSPPRSEVQELSLWKQNANNAAESQINTSTIA